MRMIITILMISYALCTEIGAEIARFPRHPAPSPDGSQIAFSWQGDIWIIESTGGIARRMTIHPSADRYPIWSPDGSLIAFASTRHGQYDIFVVPSDGKEPPQRLTYASSGDIPCDFTADGRSIIFSSHRTESVRSLPGLYSVPITGGTPHLFQTALGRWLSVSPDGDSRLFVRGLTPWTRSGYRGSANSDIWLQSGDKDYSRITDFQGDDECPDWVDNAHILFLSSRSGRKNLYIQNLEDGTVRQITYHTEYDVRFPRISADGSLIAYECDKNIYLFSTQTQSTDPLLIDVPMDYHKNPVQHSCISQDAGEIAVHPQGTCVAFTIKGDIFLVELLGKEELEFIEPRTRQLTRSVAEEKDLSWSPSGNELLFTSDRDGNDDLFLIRADDSNKDWFSSGPGEMIPVINSPFDDFSAQFSPDGTMIAFLRNRGDLILFNREQNREYTLLETWLPPEFRWSPDSRYISYATYDESYNMDVWISQTDGAFKYNLSQHPDRDCCPRWSPDGKRIIWVSRRHEDTDDLWGVWLRREDEERTNRSWFEYWQSVPGTDDTDSPENIEPVTIDYNGLWERAAPITNLLGNENEPEFIDKGQLIVFSAEERNQRDLYSVRWDGSDLRRLTKGNRNPRQICTFGEEKTILYRTESGMIRRISADGDDELPVAFDACFSVDREVEHGWIFRQIWRLMNKWYYDPLFHGTSWEGQFSRYAGLVRYASSEEDFEDVIDLMLGELNSSHVNYRSPRSGSDFLAGWIGAGFAPWDGGPGILVTTIIPGTPVDRVDVNITAGNRIISVDGIVVGRDTNIYEHLIGKTGKDVLFEVMDNEENARSVVINPIPRSDVNRSLYDHWVRERRTITENLSNDSIGYMHIRSMNENSFEHFETALYAAGHGRQGLIIDIRSNGGGWITDYLLTSLTVERHSFTKPSGYSDSLRAYPQVRLPFAAWTKPAMVLCNEESFSNAEIFAHAFKFLNRGLLIGTPTFGGVISTGNITLMNGGTIRLPRRGWYNAVTGEDLENNGAQPDEIVFQPPREDCSLGKDTQLEYAVSRFIDIMEQDPRYGNW